MDTHIKTHMHRKVCYTIIMDRKLWKKNDDDDDDDDDLYKYHLMSNIFI